MRQTGSRHDEVMVSHTGSMTGMCTADNHRILTNDIVVTDVSQCVFSLICKILRNRSNHCSLIYSIPLSHASTAHQTRIRHNYIIIAYLDILVDIGKRMNGNVFSNLCRRIHVS